MADETAIAESETAAGLNGVTLEDVVETFELMDDWEDRYRYIIELGRKLPPLPEEAYTDANKVRGCASQVWFISREEEGGEPRLILLGDSDAHIVKGLIALLLLIFSGKTRAEIRQTDAREILESLELEQHLSPMRANGLHAMLGRIQQLAAGSPASESVRK